MIQFNLLPDVKLEYIKAQRARRLVLVCSILVTGASLLLLVLILGANGLQKKHISDLSADIASQSSKLQGQKDINRILTVQNQLVSLTGLHDKKPAASRLFTYLNQVTPPDVSINNFTTDFTTQATTITGSAKALSDVNRYVDTLKYTKYSYDNTDTSTPAFKDVVLTAFSLTSTGAVNGQPASYTITLTYDPVLFDITKKVNLSVPNVTTARATDLFQSAPTSSVKGSN